MQKALDFIKNKIGDFKPEVAIVLGSGLGGFTQGLEGITIPYSEIEGFSPSAVVGHKGELLFCEVNGKKCVIACGRFHFYEGHSLQSTTLPIKIFKKLGAKTVILTNAAGSAKKDMPPGSIMLINDHINFMGTNPLIGKNDDTLGTRFPSMNDLYAKDLRDLVKKLAKESNTELFEGVYCAVTGPSYETPAEIKMFGLMGASAVGMSTVPEAIIAKYCDMQVVGISLVTNFCAGLSEVAPNHAEVVEMGQIAGEKLVKLLKEFIKEI